MGYLVSYDIAMILTFPVERNQPDIFSKYIFRVISMYTYICTTYHMHYTIMLGGNICRAICDVVYGNSS